MANTAPLPTIEVIADPEDTGPSAFPDLHPQPKGDTTPKGYNFFGSGDAQRRREAPAEPASTKPKEYNYFEERAQKLKAQQEAPSTPPGMTTGGRILEDIHDLGTGAAKGVIGLPGIPGNLQALANAGVRWGSNKLGYPLNPPQILPTSEDFIHAAEKVVGPFHKSQTPEGNYLQTIGEFLPGSTTGGAGFLGKAANVGKYAVAPGITSEAAGQFIKESNPELEPYARAIAAVGTAGLTGLGHNALGSFEQAVKDRLPPGVDPTVVDRAAVLMKDAKAPISFMEALSQAYGSPVMQKSQQYLEGAPLTRGIFEDFYHDRADKTKAAVKGLAKDVSPTTADYSTGAALSKAADTNIKSEQNANNVAVRPDYAAAEKVNLTQGVPAVAHGQTVGWKVPPGEYDQFKDNPIWKAGLSTLRGDKVLGPAFAHLPDNNVAVLDAVKKLHDQHVENLRSGVAVPQDKLKAAIIEHGRADPANKFMGMKDIVDIADQATGGRYKAARDVWQALTEKYVEPLQEGPLGALAKGANTQKAIDILFKSDLPNRGPIIKDVIGRLEGENPAATRQIVRAHIEQTLNKAVETISQAPDRIGAKIWKTLAANPADKEALQAAVEASNPTGGKKVWQGAEKLLDNLESMKYRKDIGSMTEPFAQEQASLGKRGKIKETAKTIISPGEWLEAGEKKWGALDYKWRAQGFAKMLTDPNSVDLLKRAASLPSNSQIYKALTARLILMANQSQIGVKP